MMMGSKCHNEGGVVIGRILMIGVGLVVIATLYSGHQLWAREYQPQPVHVDSPNAEPLATSAEPLATSVEAVPLLVPKDLAEEKIAKHPPKEMVSPTRQEMYQRGWFAFTEKRYREAVRLLEPYLDGGEEVGVQVAHMPVEDEPVDDGLPVEVSPAHKTRFILGRAYLELGLGEQAAAHMRRIVDEPTLEPVRDHMLSVIAEGSFKAGKFRQALGRYQGFLDAYPTSPWAPRARFRVADCLYLDNRYNEARKLYEQLLKRYPEYPGTAAVQLAVADCLINTRRQRQGANRLHRMALEDMDPRVTQRARKMLEELATVGVKPDGLGQQERFNLGRRFRVHKRWPEAEWLLGELVEEMEKEQAKTGDRPALLVGTQYQRGRNFFAWEKYPEALESFLAVEGLMNRRVILRWIARTHERLADPDAAAEVYGRYTSGIALTRQLANVYYWQARYDQAREHLEALFERAPHLRRQRGYRWQMTWLDYRQGDYDKAAQGFRGIADQDARQRNKARYWLARTLLNQGKVDEAVELFELLARGSSGRDPDYYVLISRNRLFELRQQKNLGEEGSKEGDEQDGAASYWWEDGVSDDPQVLRSLIGGVHTGPDAGEGIGSGGNSPTAYGGVTDGFPFADYPFGYTSPMWAFERQVRPSGPYAHKPVRRFEGARTPWIPPSGPSRSRGHAIGSRMARWPANEPPPPAGARFYWGQADGMLPVVVGRLAGSGQREAILEIVTQLSKDHGDVLPRLERARVLIKLGMLESAREELAIVAEEVRAARRRRGGGDTRARLIAALGGSYMDNRKTTLGLWGSVLREADVPADELRKGVAHTNRLRGLSGTFFRDLGRLFALLGDAHYTRRYLSGSTVETGVDEVVGELPEFPLAFEEEIRRFTGQYQVRPALMWGLMTLESAFYPKAVSHANARGLMQVIPITGRLIARHMGFSGYTEALLHDPEVSIRFGSWYMRQLLTKFNGQEILAIAGYNAGPHNVAYWLSRKGHLPADEFVEEMVYSQAQNYVRIVVRYLGAYLRYYEGLEMVYFPNVIDPNFRDNINF